MLKITAIGNLTNDVELKMNEATEVEFLSPRRAEEAAQAEADPEAEALAA